MTNIDKVKEIWLASAAGTAWMVKDLCLSNRKEAFTRLYTSRLWTYSGPLFIIDVVEDKEAVTSIGDERAALRVLTTMGIFFAGYSIARQGTQL